MSEVPLGDLFDDLIRAKAAEHAATARRVECEQALIARLPVRPDRGTAKLGDGTVRASIKFDVSYTADIEKIAALGPGAPVKYVPPSYEFDARRYEELRESDPETFAKVARFVTTKPKKPSVELKL